MFRELFNKPLFVVIYPYKFTDFVYDLIELDEFKRYCDVQVWDISPITTPKFSKGISAKKSNKKEIVVVLNFLDLIRHVNQLRKHSSDTKICILNEVPFGSASEFFCNLIINTLLNRRDIAIFDLYNGGVPIHYIGKASKPPQINFMTGFLAKANRFARNTTTISEAYNQISGIFLGLLARFMPSAITHRFVAGEDWMAFAKKNGLRNNQIRLIYGHSHDYSNNLLFELKSATFERLRQKIAVLLDGAGPAFGSDSIHMGRKIYFTSEAWYPALSRFFDQLEVETGVQIEIAGHYKSVHPPISPYFGNRHVYYGKTREMVRNCEFVITRTSTAISYAVMFRKPVIFIYSNQLKHDRNAMRDINGMAEMLGTVPVNIDEPQVEIQGLLKINEERYLNYEKACLTSVMSKKPNVQIILEEIMNIPFKPNFIKQTK